jgi:hypothetical protein
MGFEPMIRVLQTLALATWPRRLAGWILSNSGGMVKPIKQKPLFRGSRAGDGHSQERSGSANRQTHDLVKLSFTYNSKTPFQGF